MNCLEKSYCSKKRGILKFLTCSIAFVFAFFLGGVFTSHAVAEAAIDVEIHDSNYRGNNAKGNSYEAIKNETNGAVRYFVQGSSIAKKDVVTFTIKNFFVGQGNTYDAFAVSEEGYTGSAGTARDYDTYVYDVSNRDAWFSDSTTNSQGSGEKGLVMGDNCATNFNALSNQLKANTSSSEYVSLFCKDGNDLKYAYTLRTPGYGLKTIHIFYYKLSTGIAQPAEDYNVNIVVSKPISEFNDSENDGFTWIQKNSNSCPTDHKKTADVNITATNEICVNYDNTGSYNEERKLNIEIPKEVAYNHEPVSNDGLSDENNIKNSTIYAINTFQNNGSSKYVKYYYYNFYFETATDASQSHLYNNTTMNENYSYKLEIMIDARGNYVFYIKDLFENTFTSIPETTSNSDIVSSNNDDIVRITNISIRNLLIDYINSDKLTILKAVTELVNNSGFGGEIAELKYDELVQIMYANLQRDEATIILEAFSKVLITNGKSFCDYTGVHCTGSDDLEEIKKETLQNTEIEKTEYWKIAWKQEYTVADAAKPTTGTVSRENTLYVQGNSYLNREYNVEGHKNRLEVVVSDNARYRFYIEDIYGNNTGKDINESSSDDDFLINPYIDVTVIDRTTPVLSSGLTGADNTNKRAATTIYSYDYVVGGGRNQVPEIDLITNPDEKSIYYNSKGLKYFDYEDAIRIAQISAVDETSLNEYLIRFVSGSITNSKTANAVKSTSENDGKYSDPSSSLKSDRNTTNSTTTIGALNLHDYILSNNISSFTGGLVIPVTSAEIVSNKFTIGGTEYTINYTNDRPMNLNGTININDGRTFTINGSTYIISGNRVVTYNENSLAKTQVFETNYTILESDQYLNYSNNDNTSKTFVTALDSAYAYTNSYVGFIKITFKEVGTNTEICSVGENSDVNVNCFKEINKYIDTVRSFDMVFDVEDYVGHSAAAYTVTVNVEDNTAPGFLGDFKPQGKDNDNNDIWTNVYNNSACMLEIGNLLQSKARLIDCYLLGSGVEADNANGTYHFIDNDTTYTNDPELQWYLETGKTNYFNSIKLEIEKDDGTYEEVTSTSSIQLNRARDHNFVITISDNWMNNKTDATNNTLTIKITYYVNPRTLLIEPIANEKVYGQADPVFDYCVYINKDINTFSRASEFFDKDFLEEYFKLAYCTGTVNRTSGYDEITNIHEITNILLNGNAFAGKLSRVENDWYNLYNNGVNGIQNNYVGYYDIVLGDLAIDKTTANANAACKTTTGYTCDQDYVVKIHPEFLIDDLTSYDAYGTGQIKGTRQVTQAKTVDSSYTQFVTGKEQKQNKDPELNDEPLTESKVKFTIKQAILNVTANGGTKLFGEQDSNSHNWNNEGTLANSVNSTGYLNGYTIEGLQNTADLYYYDSNNTTSSPSVTSPTNIILGTLRREIGENVGRYMICNIKNSNPSKAFSESNVCGASTNHAHAGQYSTVSGKTFMFDAYDLYDAGGESSIAALVINTNGNVYDTSTSTVGHSLNNENRNYVINFEEAYYYIQANEMIIQPGVNQGKEYAKSPYMDPIWQLVVYGETITCTNVTTCTSNILKNDSGFTGYTADIDVYSYSELSIANYQGSNATSAGRSPDTSIYYNRRKTSPDVTYKYELKYSLTTSDGKYTNVYAKSGDYYYLDINLSSSNASWSDKYVYAYGSYHPINSVSDGKVTITIIGHLVNQTYTLFGSGTDGEGEYQAGNAKLTREGNDEVGWYKFNSIDNTSANFRLNINGRSECVSKIGESGIINATVDGANKCRNYNLTFEDSAPDSYKDTTGNDISLAADANFDMSTIGEIITIQDTNNEYRPDGKNGCYTHSSNYTSRCDDADKSKVLFEIFKREIVISFDANKYTFIYGNRYDYYDGGSHYVNNEVQYNSKNGIFHIYDGNDNGQNSSEGDIFVCYDENKIAARCTNDPRNTTTYDYGVTRGDTWTSVGLEFYLHPLISKSNTNFYSINTGSGYAIPAGTYFVYADISDTAKANYKFTYLGGTLTINPKVTSVQLTSYTMEYGETNYYSYGLGTNYSDYTSYLTRCMADSNYATSSDTLITGCGSEENILGNTYGFTIEGLDSKDTIANSFKGRPSREEGSVVGYYKIGVNTISTIQNVRGLANPANSIDTCTSMANNNNLEACSVYKQLDTQNYDISYSLANNEGAYLFITPANINIEIDPNQTKMYGCAYSEYNISSEYPYTVAGGYSTCDETNKNPSDDIAYRYTVTGDKNYTAGSSYVVSKTKGSADGSEFPSNSSLEGSLYRVDKVTGFIDYIGAYNKSKNDIYQGQSVGDYIITLGDLNAKKNGTNKCDVFNNPAVDGTLPCRNFNLNYYGNSAANHYVEDDATKDATSLASGSEKHENHVDHKYSIAAQILVNKLKTYNLNYVESATGNYYYINGKFVSSAEIATLTNYYVNVDSLTKYKLKAGYIFNGYLYRESSTGTYYRENNEFKLVTGANIADTTLRYEQVSQITSEADKYEALAADEAANLSSKVYVNINGKFVSLDSLKKYKLEKNVYSEDASGSYVLIYLETASSGLTRYTLDINNMYVETTGTTGAYVFINGSYVLKSTALAIIEGAFSSTINVNSAMVLDGQTVDSGIIVDGKFYGGSVDSSKHASTSIDDVATANATLFTITRRNVHVHTEYNVKYVGNDDLIEIITCEQLFTSYGLGSDYSARSYCTDGSTEIQLGKARYYAVDNSLAKYPWTEWVDKNNGEQISDSVAQRRYNDIQYDVLTGRLERRMTTTDGKEDPVGKYVYNFANINVTDSTFSGQNYKIYIETSTTWDKTYIKDSTGTVTLNGENYKLLDTYSERYSDSACSIRDDINGYYIKINGGTCASISFADKNRATETNAVGGKIDFWYLGFYAIDGSEGREGQQKKWWTGTKDKDNKKSNNNELFKNHYDKLKLGKNNNDNDLTAADGFVRIENWDLTVSRETYFEIVRKTIYLYAVDESKIYGTADKYENFRVAICATNLGYIIDENGNVSCVETESDYDSETNGLTAEHQSLFYLVDGSKKIMKQNEIKGAQGYAFIGTSDTSMKIYFKRTAGENAGVYSITACATQEGITDCSDPSQEEQAGGNRVSIGDDYRIVEISGTLTIETRKITISPDEAQGFMYGNYTNNGAIPSITYKEYFGYGDNGTNKSQGLVNSGNSDTDSNVATCLINVSGESVVCINDNQNNEVSVSSYVYMHQAEYGTSATRKNSYTASTIAGWSNVCSSTDTENCRFVNVNNVYKDYYSDPDEANFNSRVESEGGQSPSLSPSNDYRYALNRICGSTTDLRYGRDVCNYEIVAGELSVGSVWEQKTIDEYVRMVFTNLYTKKSDSTWELYKGVTMTVDGVQRDNVKDFSNLNYENLYLKVGNRYYPVTEANRYGYGYEIATLDNNASYVRGTDGGYYKITEEYRYSDSACSGSSVTGNYLKNGAGECIEIRDGVNTYKLSKNKVQNNTGEFLKISSTSGDNDSYAYNYTIEKFITGVTYKVEEATLEATPLVDQYKIYGEADPEIEFNVTTTYTVKSDHLIPFSNIKTINGEVLAADVQKYDANYTINASGLYVKVLANQVVVLNGYAYMENMGVVADGTETLNYGKNYSATKHTKSELLVTNATTGAIHYDAYTTYNTSIDISRILIGNFYVEGHNQNVGVRRILNGFVVANNILGNKNYLLPAENVNGGATETNATNSVEGTVKFTIIPRPMYIEINSVTKMYGTSTDILSCDDGVTECTANGLSNGQQYLAYNYVINETKDGRASLTATALGSVQNVYAPGELMGINLPTVKSSARNNYASITTFTSDRYYIGSNIETGEVQGGTTITGTTQARNDLQIIVERGNYNTSRNTNVCYVNGEGYSMLTGKGCEDVGVYYLNFKGTHQKSSSFATGSYEESIQSYYHDDYWGYNPNYYMIIENTTDTSIDTDLNKETSDANSYHILRETQKMGTTLEITKKPIEIVIETFDGRNTRTSTDVGGLVYTGTLGEVYNIEQGTDVPDIPMISNTANHTTYQNITWYMHPSQVRTKDNIFGNAAYYQTPISEKSGETIEETVQKYILNSSDYSKLVYHNNGSNNANSGPIVFDTSIAGYYAITRDINQLYIRYGEGNGSSMTYTGDNSQYELNNYTTTFVNGILKIDNDKTAPVIFAGSEYYTIEANNGELTNMDNLSEDAILTYLNALKSNKCKNYTAIQDENGTFSYGDCDSTLFATAIKITSNKFKLNNYEWTISGNSIQRDGGNVSIAITNNQFTMNDLSGTSRTYTIAKNGDTPILVLLKGDSTDASAIEISTAEKLMQWFNIRSHDPSIMRNGVEQPKRYNARYYFAIDENFNQRVVGDYTIYIYAADNAGNISRATTVTLRVQDTTSPEVGNLNLYSGKVTCDYNSVDCQKEENWKVAETVWIHYSAVNDYNLEFITDKKLYNYGGSTESPQGEFYRIAEGSDARAIKHLNWSNSTNGIYMTITENSKYDDTNNDNYSKDNTINYLNLDGYVKLTKNGDNYTVGITSTSGKYSANSYILLGSVVNLNNITHYYKQDTYFFPTDPTKETKTDSTGYPAGTVFYVRINGNYVELSSLTRYNLEANTYVKASEGSYIFVGELKDVSGLQRYNGNFIWSNDGSYIKLDQWDHYFSRDNGASWIKYDRETTTGYIALGEDGKRLISIKAVDNGVEFTLADSTNTVNGTAKNYFDSSYYYDLPIHGANSGTWNNPGSHIVSEDFKEYSVRNEHYNISDWTADAGKDGYYRDRKYAYLDTQQPTLELDGHLVKVYEYGCTNCTAGYKENYGKVEDAYFVPIANFKRYSDAAGTTRSDTGAYILVYKKNANRIDAPVTVEILSSKRLYSESTTKTTAAACVGVSDKWVNNKCYEQNDTGTHVYLGVKLDSNDGLSVDTVITGKISAAIGTNTTLSVLQNNGDSIGTTNATLDNSNSNVEKVIKNTSYEVAGVSGGNIMSGTSNSQEEFDSSDYKHKNVVIYLAESSPIAGLKSILTGDIFGTLKNSVAAYDTTYYYKYVISATANDSWTIRGWYSTNGGEDSNFTTLIPGLSLGTFTTLEAAINKIVTDDLTNKSYAGKNLTFSINYTSTDMAGNVSKSSVRGSILSDFLSTVVFTRGEYTDGTTSQYLSSYTLEVGQNTNALSVMGKFNITTTKSSSYDKYIVQTVYYNDKIIANEQKYDENYLAKLDTSVPGTYKIVYNTKVMDNGNAVYSKPFELIVNVKPTVASINNRNINYRQVIMVTSLLVSIMAIGAYTFLMSRKRKHN